MIEYQTVRPVTLFANGVFSETSSAMFTASGITNTNGYTSYGYNSDGITVNMSQAASAGNYVFGTNHGGGNAEQGGTTSQGDTFYYSTSSASNFNEDFNSTISGSYSSTQNITGESYSTTYDGFSLGYGIYSELTSTANYTYATEVNTTTSAWTLTTGTAGSSGLLFPVTHSETTTASSTATSSIGGTGLDTYIVDVPLTTTHSFTYGGEAPTSGTFDVPMEYGTVYSSDTDWLWSLKSISSNNTSPSFFTDIANSFVETTFWPIYSTDIVSYFGYSESDVTQAFTVSQFSRQFTIEYLTSFSTGTSTITSGQNFPRDTATTSYLEYSTSSFTDSAGGGTYEIDGYSTISVGTVITVPEQITLHATYPLGLDAKSTTLLSTTSAYSTTSVAIEQPAYLAGGGGTISEGGGAQTSAFGFTQEQTTLIPLYTNLASFGASATALQSVAAKETFLPPQYLKSGSNQSFGGNLSFQGQTILYPFLSGVYNNVFVPGYSDATSTTGTNSHTSSYKWSTDTAGATLLYSDISSYVSGTATLKTSTVSSGTFGTESSLFGSYVSQNYYADSVFGGFADLPFPESVYFPPRAVEGTSILTNGSSSTYKTLDQSFASSTVRETMIVEESVPAYTPIVGNDGVIFPQVFPRNQGG